MSPFDNTNAIKHPMEAWRCQVSTGRHSFQPTELQGDPAPVWGSAPMQGSALGSKQDSFPSPSCPLRVYQSSSSCATRSCKAIASPTLSPFPWDPSLRFFHSWGLKWSLVAVTQRQPPPLGYQGQKTRGSTVVKRNIVLIKLEILFVQPPDCFWQAAEAPGAGWVRGSNPFCSAQNSRSEVLFIWDFLLFQQNMGWIMFSL